MIGARRSNVLPIIGLMLLSLTLAVFGALMVGQMGPKAGAFYIILMAGLGVLFLPIDFLVLLTWVITTLVAGSIQYLAGGWKYAQWMSFALAFACLIKLPFALAKQRHARTVRNEPPPGVRPPMMFLGLFWLVAAISSVINLIPPLQLLVFSKNALAMWAIALLVAAGCLKDKTVERMWYSLVAVLFLQIPMALYQRFVVVLTRRADGGQYDAVSGTFGGDPMGGGANSVLVLYAIAAAVFAFCLGRIGRWRAAFITVIVMTALALIAMGEVKIAIVLLPVAAAVVFFERLVRNPLHVLLWTVITAVIGGGLLLFYQAFYWSDISVRHRTLGGSLEASIEYVVSPDNINWYTGEIGRGASIALWWDDGEGDPAKRFLGYGAGESRNDSSLAIGELARRYMPLNIAATSVSQLLWDFGLVGCLLFVAMLIASIRECTLAIGGAPPDSLESAIARTARVILVICFIFLPYNRTPIDLAPVEALMALAIGSACLIRRRQVQQTVMARRSSTGAQQHSGRLRPTTS